MHRQGAQLRKPSEPPGIRPDADYGGGTGGAGTERKFTHARPQCFRPARRGWCARTCPVRAMLAFNYDVSFGWPLYKPAGLRSQQPAVMAQVGGEF